MKARSTKASSVKDLLEQYEKGLDVTFPTTPHAAYERRLIFDHMVEPTASTLRQRYESIASALRDLLSQRWLLTGKTYDRENPKRVYYLSMEFLLGRSLTNNLTNLMVEPIVQDIIRREGMDLLQLAQEEPDAGLGNGGLGRLAACFIDSLASMQIPAMGYGLRYHYGIFRQQIQNGYQIEQPDLWLRHPDPWEVGRPEEPVPVKFNASVRLEDGTEKVSDQPAILLGTPYDRPVVGYGGHTINTLRLWEASAPEAFDFDEFSSGDFVAAVHQKIIAERLTRVLYPDDSTERGRNLRLAQEYFLVACSMADIVARFLRRGNDWQALPDKVAIQLNDTHPAMAVAELMRILLDQAGLGWEDAWDLTTRTLAYTNHTLLPEALEKWPVELFQRFMPRHLEIIYEINRHLLHEVQTRFPGDDARMARMSLVEETPIKQVRMAHLAIVGSHSTNGVAAIHSELLRTTVVKDFADMFPERFNNKTNGVTPRRWLLLANPDLSKLITETIGDGWVVDLAELRQLLPYADDPAFRKAFRQAKRAAKLRFADWLRGWSGQEVDADSIFDCQIKRIHEYKRQLLNVLHIILLYNQLRYDPHLEVPPRTFFFAGKAAPAYYLAKLIIKLINDVAAVIDADPAVRDRLKVLFLPEYNVSLAERLIPASDVSEQISTAGYEASGMSNMKFMMNGALTIGTRDGATIEMAKEAGEENFFLFGLTAEEVLAGRGWYNPHWHYEHEPEIRYALDMIRENAFSHAEPGVFAPIWDVLMTHGDHYMHLADLSSYARAQEKVGELYGRPDDWARKAILNVGHSGRFSSDRTIAEYATDIWRVEPCPVR
jgi:glycogen phosphorylase